PAPLPVQTEPGEGWSVSNVRPSAASIAYRQVGRYFETGSTPCNDGDLSILVFAADEVGFAFFQKRLDGFLVVPGLHGHHLVSQPRIHDQVGLLLEPIVHRQLAPPDSPGGTVSQF